MTRLPVLAAALVLATAAAPAIDAGRIRADVATLASDRFAGRGPGEIGERQTIAFLAKRFRQLGLSPGGRDGSWLQAVPLVRLDRAPGARAVLVVGEKTLQLTPGRDITLALQRPGRTALERMPLVFGGYGVVDADKGFEPYAGVDLTGKVVVLLAGDPDFEAGPDGAPTDAGFEGRRLVLAGRYGVKVAAAARAGAAGVMVIHETAAASYPFAQLTGTDGVPAFQPDGWRPGSLAFSGWLGGPTAGALIGGTGQNLAALKAMARRPEFRAFALPGATMAVSGSVTATPVISHNVIAMLKGASRPDQYVLYGAHWDANGNTAPDTSGDRIRNGAIDNATGTAELLEVARVIAAGPRPARSIIFAAWTAEEKGLLGSQYFASHPTVPLARVAAVINLDPHLVLPAARNLELVGSGRTTLEADLAGVARDMALRLDDEPFPEAGWYFRSDHYPLAVAGVPALSFRAGRDLVEGGAARGLALTAEYNSRCYHQPCDAFDPAWTFAGTAQEAEAALRLGLKVAGSRDWPGWTGAADFARTREASAAERK